MTPFLPILAVYLKHRNFSRHFLSSAQLAQVSFSFSHFPENERQSPVTPS